MTELKWPEEYFEIIPILQKHWKAKSPFKIRNIFNSGRSGACVAVVEAATTSFNGIGILKIECSTERNEGELHKALQKTDGKFSQEHIPEVVEEYNDQDYSAFLMKLFKGGLSYTRPLSRLPHDKQGAVYQEVSEKLLSGWNTDFSIAPPETGAQLLRSWLQHRIDPVKGRIHDFLSQELELAPSSLSFNVEEKILPNPLCYIRGEAGFEDDVKLSPVMGRLHNDLHSENILAEPDGPYHSKFYLIDLAEYSEASPLFYDQAYLETSILIDARANVSLNRWDSLCKTFSGTGENERPKAEDSDDQGLCTLVHLIRSEVYKWISSNLPDRRQDLCNQARLARIAAALNFVNKRTSRDKKRNAFLLAAYHLEQYLQFNNIPWSKQGSCEFEPGSSYPRPTSDDWRPAWDFFDGFDNRYNGLILIAGSHLDDLDANELSILGRIPWSLVIDLNDNSAIDGLYASTSHILKQVRSTHLLCPGDKIDINSQSCACWFMAQGMSGRPETTAMSERVWRRTVPASLREIIEPIVGLLSPQPMRVLVIGSPNDATKIQMIWNELDRVIEDRGATMIVHEPDCAPITLDDTQGEESKLVRTLAADKLNLLRGIRELLGEAHLKSDARIPCKGSSNYKHIAAEQLASINETIELVHLDLLKSEDPSHEDNTRSFLKGTTISWRELDYQEDIHRNIAKKLEDRIRNLLNQRRSGSIKLFHSPGAGGTTVSRRIAWNISGDFSTAIVRCWTKNTVDRIEELFSLSGLPVFVVVESANLMKSHRDVIYNGLKGRNVGFVFLDVERSSVTRSTAGQTEPIDSSTPNKDHFKLLDPMHDDEAKRFAQRYKINAPASRIHFIDSLLKPENRMFRSPFFFGLYTFEKEFTNIPGYVTAQLADCSPRLHRAINHIALVSRFTQLPLSLDILRVLLQISPNETLKFSDDFGQGAKQLLNFDPKEIRVVHPLIAEEILRQRFSTRENASEASWKSNLGEFCIQFITDMSQPGLSNSGMVKDILYQLFIRREEWFDVSVAGGRRDFSELLMLFQNPERQLMILQKLCEEFPNDAHFWSHLGRHLSLESQRDYEEAKNCLIKAINLEPKNHIHHHALGMVYRVELRKKFDIAILDKEDIHDTWTELAPLFDSAESSFDEARLINPESDYPIVTPIQMITDTVNSLHKLSGRRDFPSFLNGDDRIAEWCRAQVRQAEELMQDLRRMHGTDELPAFAATCEGRIQEFYGNVGEMLEMLGKLLKRQDIAQSPVRRLIAHAYRRRAGNDMDGLSQNTLVHIKSMMEQNLQEDSTNNRDLQMWFHASRRLPDFNMLSAMDRLKTWASIDRAPIEAYYYLYILQFLKLHHRLIDDPRDVLPYIQDCKQYALTSTRTHSFEWLGKKPDWCPIVSQQSLKRDQRSNAVDDPEKLAEVNGIITKIKGPSNGTISVYGLPAFFVPGQEFRAGRDENAAVTLYLGFSYEGLRAWHVARA